MAVFGRVLRTADGRLLTSGGRPLASALGEPLPQNPGVPPPAGWPLVLEDTFPAGSSLSTTRWAIRYGGGASANGGAYVWDAAGAFVGGAGGLVLRAWNPGTGWRAGGIQQGSLAANGLQGYGDLQLDVIASVPAGKGVGAYASLLAASGAWPPELALFETPGTSKSRVRTNWRWPPSGQAPVEFAIDATKRVQYTARRVGSAWRYWINGVERTVPVEWANNPSAEKLVVALAAFVAGAADSWYGGAPDGTTPTPYEAVVHSVRLYAPSAPQPGINPAPDADTVAGEYPAGPTNVSPTGPAGPLVRGDANAALYLAEAASVGNEGLAAMTGVLAGTFDAGSGG